MMVDWIKSGIPFIDNQHKGLPKGKVIVYLCDLPSSRVLAIESFMKENTQKTLFITTKHHKNDFTNLTVDGFELDKIVTLDAVSWRYDRIKPKNKKKAEDYSVSNLIDLNNLLSKIVLACKENPEISRMVFDSPSSLLLYSTPGKEQVFRFFELLTAYTRNEGISFIYTLDPKIHESTVVSTLQFLSDGSIEIMKRENGTEVRIIEIPYTNADLEWHPIG
jgi:hypothetical protein